MPLGSGAQLLRLFQGPGAMWLGRRHSYRESLYWRLLGAEGLCSYLQMSRFRCYSHVALFAAVAGSKGWGCW